jgi:uncharacterized protein (DUF305 family)
LATLVILLCVLDMQALQHDSHTHLGNTSVIDPNWSELNSSMEKMHQAMASVEASGDGDVDFVRLMLPHHQAAIDMAKTQLMYGKDPQMRRLAQEIITDQQSEIALMQLWLTQRAALSANPGHVSDPR